MKPFPYIPPVPEPVLERGDDLDWGSLPDQPTDLNFRPPLDATTEAQWRLLGQLVLIAFLAIPFALFFRAYFGHCLLTKSWFAIAFLCACCIGLYRSAAPERDNEDRLLDIIWSYFVPLQCWAVIALASVAVTPWRTLGYFVVIVLPITFRFVEQFAAHAVYWHSASPQLPLGTMLDWRKAWHDRFTYIVTREAASDQADSPLDISAYWIGWINVVVGLAVGFIVWIVQEAHNEPTYRAGLALFLPACIAMLGISCITTRPRFGPWWRFFAAWYSYGNDQRLPAWVMPSPSGSPLQRQWLLMLTIPMVTIGCCYLTDYFSWLLTCDPDLVRILRRHGAVVGDPPVLRWAYFQQGGALAAFYALLTLAVNVLAPVLFLVVTVNTATSPLLFKLSTLPRRPS